MVLSAFPPWCRPGRDRSPAFAGTGFGFPNGDGPFTIVWDSIVSRFNFKVLLLLSSGHMAVDTFTIVMGQNLFPQNLGVASGLLVGFAIG